jgi:hypothetical protein
MCVHDRPRASASNRLKAQLLRPTRARWWPSRWQRLANRDKIRTDSVFTKLGKIAIVQIDQAKAGAIDRTQLRKR